MKDRANTLLHLFERRSAGDPAASDALRQSLQVTPLESVGDELLSVPRSMVLDAHDLWRDRSEGLVDFWCTTLRSRDASTEHRRAAAELLKELCAPASRQSVLDVVLTRDTDATLRSAVLAALERLFFANIVTDEDVLSVASANCTDDSEQVRVELVKLVATSRSDWSIEHIEECLSDSGAVAEAALHALVQHRNPKAGEILARSVDLVPVHLRQHASALRRLRDASDARARAETVATAGQLLGAEDVKSLVRNKQYATILRLLKDSGIDPDGLTVLKAITETGEVSKSQRQLIRKIKVCLDRGP